MTARSIRDTLIAETLGDVLKLHDTVKALPDELRESLAPALDDLTKAVEVGKKSIDEYVQAQAIPLHNFSAKEAEGIRKLVAETTASTLQLVAKDLQAASALHRKAVSEASGKRWVWVGLAAGVGLAASVIGSAGTLYAYSYLSSDAAEEIAEQAKYGRALLAALPSLDEKTKAKIKDSANHFYSSAASLIKEKGQ
jgi:hypothetical protein